MPRPDNTVRRVYLGLDPGASGGLVALCGREFSVTAMPTTEKDLWGWLCAHSPGLNGEAIAVVEKVNGYVGDGGNPGSAMFKFGANYGKLLMALTAAGIPFEEVSPATWQRGLSIPPRKKGEAKGVWKNRLKARAQQLFPRVNVTLATADALLIAEYCRRKTEGRL